MSSSCSLCLSSTSGWPTHCVLTPPVFFGEPLAANGTVRPVGGLVVVVVAVAVGGGVGGWLTLCTPRLTGAVVRDHQLTSQHPSAAQG